MSTSREPALEGQTVLVLGGSRGIGFETARLARAEGAAVILTARDPNRLHRAGLELQASIAAFDRTDFDRLRKFFDGLPAQVDHVLVTCPGPDHTPLPEFDLDGARRDVDAHLFLPIQVARHAAAAVRPPGTVVFMGAVGDRRIGVGMTLVAALSAAMPALTRSLALELAPIRVNLIAAGFIDATRDPAESGEDADARRARLRASLPIGRLVTMQDVAALAVHVMTDTAVTGATFDIDGGQQLVER
jgi:NAD(P)-dependent dehydrogenase (short-subunit alcohol dehydrogenase family)